jgi:translation initiation factor 3 subunit C
LNKQLQRVLQINQKEGLGTPRAYIKTLALLEVLFASTKLFIHFVKDRVKATQDAKAKGEVKMNATKAKAFNAMRQKLKKNNKLYEKE